MSETKVRPDELEDEREFRAQYSETPLCVYRKLKDRARIKDGEGRNLIGYEELNQECHLGLDFKEHYHRDSNVIGNYAGAVSEFEVKKGRPMLSAVLVHVASPIGPGRGFYDFADELGQRKPGETDNQMWIRILNECHAYWSQHP
jgi:hypothetical protein